MPFLNGLAVLVWWVETTLLPEFARVEDEASLFGIGAKMLDLALQPMLSLIHEVKRVVRYPLVVLLALLVLFALPALGVHILWFQQPRDRWQIYFALLDLHLLPLNFVWSLPVFH